MRKQLVLNAVKKSMRIALVIGSLTAEAIQYGAVICTLAKRVVIKIRRTKNVLERRKEIEDE